jgi:hypothetical protein
LSYCIFIAAIPGVVFALSPQFFNDGTRRIKIFNKFF